MPGHASNTLTPPRPKPNAHGNRIMPSDLNDAAKQAYAKIESIIDGLDIPAADKNKTKLAIKHNLQHRERQIIADINSLQHQTTLAVPENVTKELDAALEKYVFDHYTNNREAFIQEIAGAFSNVDKEEEVRKAVEAALRRKEEELFKETRENAKAYVENMHMKYVNESYNSFMTRYPLMPTFSWNPKKLLTNVMSNTYNFSRTNWRRSIHGGFFEKNWKLEIAEKNKKDSDLQLEFGRAAVANEYFNFKLDKPTGAAHPYLRTDSDDAVFNFLRGNFKKATGAEGRFSKPLMSLLTYINPVYHGGNLLWYLFTMGLDTSQWCLKPRFETNPKTGMVEVTIPNYYNWFPFNTWPRDYPMKCYKRIIESKAAVGEHPTHYTQFPEGYGKRLSIWGIANCLFTAEQIGLPKDHPWAIAGEKARIKQSGKVGRAEHIDYKIERKEDMKKVPELPKAGKKADDGLKIKAKNPSQNAALSINTPNQSRRPALSVNTPNQNGNTALNVNTANQNANPALNINVPNQDGQAALNVNTPNQTGQQQNPALQINTGGQSQRQYQAKPQQQGNNVALSINSGHRAHQAGLLDDGFRRVVQTPNQHQVLTALQQIINDPAETARVFSNEDHLDTIVSLLQQQFNPAQQQAIMAVLANKLSAQQNQAIQQAVARLNQAATSHFAHQPGPRTTVQPVGSF